MVAQVDYELKYRDSLASSRGLPGGPPAVPAAVATVSPIVAGAPDAPETMDR